MHMTSFYYDYRREGDQGGLMFVSVAFLPPGDDPADPERRREALRDGVTWIEDFLRPVLEGVEFRRAPFNVSRSDEIEAGHVMRTAQGAGQVTVSYRLRRSLSAAADAPPEAWAATVQFNLSLDDPRRNLSAVKELAARADYTADSGAARDLRRLLETVERTRGADWAPLEQF